jgi:hypothetical protein
MHFGFSGFLRILLLLGAASCAAAPHQEGLYRLSDAKPIECSRVVRLLTVEQAPLAYHELAQVSATCPYVSPRTCEHILLSRGCELGADAIVVRGTHVIGRKAKPMLADDGLAIGFEPASTP